MNGTPLHHPSELTDRQRVIHRRLSDLVSPGAAKWFHTACRLMDRPEEYLAASHLVASCMREVESALRDSLEAVIAGVQAAREQESDPASQDAAGAARRKGDRCEACGQEMREVHKEEVQAVVAFLGLSQQEREAWLSLTGRGDSSLHRLTHRDNLLDPREIDERYLKWWSEIQHLLDGVLDRFEARYGEILIPIREKVAAIERPTRKDAGWLLRFVPNNPRAQRDVLALCRTVEWLVALEEVGYFKRPPGEEPGDEPGYVKYLPWPAADHLLELARVAPERVGTIIASVGAAGNPTVQYQIARVALALPAALAADWCLAYAQANHDRPLAFLLPEALAELVSHLAKGGQSESALVLARFLFQPLPDPETADRRKAAGLQLPPEPRGRFDLWHYAQHLSRVVPDLAEHCGLPALESIVTLLDEALTLARFESDESGEDGSTVWRSTIRGDGHPDHGPQNTLISAVRNLAETLLAGGTVDVATVLGLYDRHKWIVFRRLAMHALTTHPDMDRIAAILNGWGNSPYRDAEPECFDLARTQFSALPNAVRQLLMETIERGPDRVTVRELQERFEANAERWFGHTAQPVTGDQVERYVRDWQLRRLAALRLSLSDVQHERYNVLAAEFGRTGEPELHAYVTRSVDPGDPEARKRLRQLTPREILDLIDRLGTGRTVDGYVRADLVGVLAQLLAANPDQISSEVERLKSSPEDVRWRVIGAVGSALNQGGRIPWEDVFTICDVPIAAESMHQVIVGRDVRARETETTTARLLREALQDDSKSPIPFNLRSAVWNVLARLVEDPDPADDRESRDPYSTAINSVRGVALEAIIQYAFWVWRGFIAKADKPVPISFTDIPEVEDALERRLDNSIDASPAIRAVFGTFFGALVNLDEAWVRRTIDRIFSPHDPRLNRAAWECYVRHSQVPFNLLPELRSHYESAFTTLTAVSPDDDRDYLRRLADHVVLLYMEGAVDLDDPLVSGFFEHAPARERGLAIDAVGRRLYREARPSEPTLDRLRALWESRLGASGKPEPTALEERRAELSHFGRWFLSGHFDDSWALDQVIEVARLCGTVEPDSLVTARLAAVATRETARALSAAEFLVAGATVTWKLQSMLDDVRAIIRQARASGDTSLERRARELSNRLAARGFPD